LAVESYAVGVRKHLQELKNRQNLSGRSGLMDDAVALVVLIEQLAQYGQSAEAEEATELAEGVEALIDLLTAWIDELLTS
jgi:hypothetical protein